MTSALREALEKRAAELGFARLGVAVARSLPEDGARLSQWLADGHHGTMDYMERTQDVRVDVRHEGMLPAAESVIVLATAYQRSGQPAGPRPGRVARYAVGRDYHNVLGRRLRKLTLLLRDRGHQARGAVDSKPVLERAWAERAGIGFIGKNACLIVPGLGSHVFLSVVITSARLQPDESMAGRCGDCRLCLDQCPTQAFIGPRVLDARRCISYLTIEHRGPIEPSLREGMGDWIFGCDECQDVCPFNQTSRPSSPSAGFETGDHWSAVDAEKLLQMDDQAFARFAIGSPIKRPRREGMARNAAIVLGNSGQRRHLPVLQQAAAEHDLPVVKDAAQWALGRINHGV